MESLTGITDAEENKYLWVKALDQATLMQFEADQADTISKAEDPGKFKDERIWPEWGIKLENYLSTVPGVNSAPLS